MIGAIIGDLAAWTWENEHKAFYPNLISDNAQLSEFGCAYLNSASRNVIYDSLLDVSPIEALCDATGHSISYYGQWLMWYALGAWLNDNDSSDSIELRDMPYFHSWDKEEGYSRIFVIKVVQALKQGRTKTETFQLTDEFCGLIKHWKWREAEGDNSMLCLLFRAWDSFYRGFDFTSSIHNAMKWNGNRHFIATLTGLFAGAMYGCDYVMVKQKYVSNNNCFKHIISSVCRIVENNGYHHDLIHECRTMSDRKRSFFAKNNALTNVERHQWTSVRNPWEEYYFDDCVHERILKAFYPDWEHRHQLYLDEGWVYCCRSHVLLCRFQLRKTNNGWCIANLQKGDAPQEYYYALPDALSNVCVNVRDYCFPQSLEYCKYYKGELKNPFASTADKTKSNFWYGEMMFVTTNQDLSCWKELAKTTIPKLNTKQRNVMSNLTDEQKGIILYVNELFAKWCPYDKCEWIYDYCL